MRLRAILRLRCPHCLEGDVYYKIWRMHETCPNCGIRYEREAGYFMVSVFVGYVLGFFIALPVLLILFLTIRPSVTVYVLAATLTMILATPLIFHHARVIWMHIDELLDPRPPGDEIPGK
jgi:uncharacterized protein (DUF983 family)